MPHFENEFKPNSDVIYGTGDWIHVYLYNFWFTWPYGYPELKDINHKGKAFTYRSLNPYDPDQPDTVDKVTSSAHDKYGVNVINNYNLPIKSNLYKGQLTQPQIGMGPAHPSVVAKNAPVLPQPTDAEQQRYLEYFQSLQNSVGYGPGSLIGGPESWAKAVSKYEQGDALNLSVKKDLDKLPGIVSDIAIRRSCKFGVHYFVEQKGARLHYILDGMDVNAIVRGDRYVNATTGKGKVPICTSEVRYIFRNWNRLGATNRLLFYKDFQTIPAPWMNQDYQGTWVGWAEYGLKRYDKYKDRVPGGAQKSMLEMAAKQFTANKGTATARVLLNAFFKVPSALLHSPEDDILPIN